LLSVIKIARQTTALNPAKTTRMLLRLIRASQPISRIEIARRLDVNRSTVTEIVKPLIKGGIIREESYQADDVNRVQGRPPIGLCFNDHADFFVGLNLGVRHTQIGLATITGEVLTEVEFETPTSPETALILAREKIEHLCSRVRGRKLRAVGVSVPGPIDVTCRKLIYAPHLDWSDVAVADALEFDKVPVVVENDATAAAIFESRIKHSQSTNNLFENFIWSGLEPELALDW
jgi:DNA-binding transcriptional ArsR family regulator